MESRGGSPSKQKQSKINPLRPWWMKWIWTRGGQILWEKEHLEETEKLPVTKSQCFAVLCIYDTGAYFSFPKKGSFIQAWSEMTGQQHPKMNSLFCFVMLSPYVMGNHLLSSPFRANFQSQEFLLILLHPLISGENLFVPVMYLLCFENSSFNAGIERLD